MEPNSVVDRVKNWMRDEPQVVLAAVELLVLVVAAFGFDLAAEHIVALLAAVGVPGVAIARSQTVPLSGLPAGDPEVPPLTDEEIEAEVEAEAGE